LLATGFRFPSEGVLLSLGPVSEKYWFADEARVLANDIGLPIYATEGTAEMLLELGIPCRAVGKGPGSSPNALDLIGEKVVDLVINVPREFDELGRPDGYLIRRRAVDAGIPLLTDLLLARAVVEAMRWRRPESLSVVAWDDYLRRETRLLT
jgi:carbamoyl-phosphate synthase large subunit